MDLHDHPDIFDELIAVTAEAIGLPLLYIEKDYWVTYALKQLAESLVVDSVVFKGGTSLSKAYRLIDRFSEDIDLAIFAGGISDHKRKRLLKQIEAAVSCGLIALPNDKRESKGSNFRKTVYRYPRHTEGSVFGQASSVLLVEVNAFTTPEPFEQQSLQTFIADSLTTQGRADLIAQFKLEPFSMNILSVERTLIEKILGMIKDSYHETPTTQLANRIRHLYDICQILKHQRYRDFVASPDFKNLCALCISDDQKGFLGQTDYLQKPLTDAPLFTAFKDWVPTLTTTYSGVFSDLVYGDLPPIADIEEALRFVRKHL